MVALIIMKVNDTGLILERGRYARENNNNIPK
jgi:hypothetical protein